MRYVSFRSTLRDFPVFSLGDARAVDPRFDRRRLNEWQAKGYIKKIINRHYIFTDIEVDENRLFEIAGRIYKPSYISLQSALSRYQIIPEAVYGITSVSTRRTCEFETPLASFLYRTLRKNLFFGYGIVEHKAKLARLEKAILDLFYLNPRIKSSEEFLSIRIDVDSVVEQLDRNRLMTYPERFEQKRLEMRIKSFLEWMDNA